MSGVSVLTFRLSDDRLALTLSRTGSTTGRLPLSR